MAHKSMSRKQLLGAAVRLSRGNRGGLIGMIRNVEYGDRKKHQRTYLDGLKRYKNKGVRNGKRYSRWEKTEAFIWETMSAPNRAV